jgi:hypothetical protein
MASGVRGLNTRVPNIKCECTVISKPTYASKYIRAHLHAPMYLLPIYHKQKNHYISIHRNLITKFHSLSMNNHKHEKIETPFTLH